MPGSSKRRMKASHISYRPAQSTAFYLGQKETKERDRIILSATPPCSFVIIWTSRAFADGDAHPWPQLYRSAPVTCFRLRNGPHVSEGQGPVENPMPTTDSSSLSLQTRIFHFPILGSLPIFKQTTTAVVLRNTAHLRTPTGISLLDISLHPIVAELEEGLAPKRLSSPWPTGGQAVIYRLR